MHGETMKFVIYYSYKLSNSENYCVTRGWNVDIEGQKIEGSTAELLWCKLVCSGDKVNWHITGRNGCYFSSVKELRK
jgi:hypothetical protein